ncbi:MAG: adenylyltransferase/cytidyltransferase family protein [Thermoplasmatota archaeon]
MQGLVVGRFQPLHNGHAALLKAAAEDCVHVTVALGSSNAKQAVRNPFTVDERTAMLAAVAPDARVVPVPDLHDPPRWADHVLDLVGPVDRVFGNDDRTLDLFEDLGIAVRRTGLVERERYEASTIRMQMAEGDPAWRRAVPASVVALLDGWDVEKRLRLLEARA